MKNYCLGPNGDPQNAALCGKKIFADVTLIKDLETGT